LLTSIFISILIPTTVGAKFGSNKRPEVAKDAAMTTTRGVILLNKKIVQKYLKKYNFIVIDYNYARNRLALKPYVKRVKNSVPIQRTRKDKVAIVIDKNRLKNTGADISKKKYYECTWNPDRKVIVIDYSSPVTRKDLE
jgi:hypothetical protein